MLMLTCHGGKCCAIKHIFGFNNAPDDDELEPELEEKKPNPRDTMGLDVSSNEMFFTGAAPEESTRERLERYLAFLRKTRPGGIVEVTLAEGECINQIAVWGRILKGYGFKTVNKVRNSNSGNLVYVYHLVMEE